jgi:hypothetical protein
VLITHQANCSTHEYGGINHEAPPDWVQCP